MSDHVKRKGLTRFHDRFQLVTLDRPSPFSIPVLMEVRTEQVRGEGVEHILAQATIQIEAEEMMEEVRAAVAQLAHRGT